MIKVSVKPKINRERKSFELKHRRVIRELHPFLSNTVRLSVPDLPDVCMVSFSDEFVRFVGSCMPRGISTSDPAYVSVEKEGPFYLVWGAYLDGGTFIKLWQTTERPKWLPEK